MKEFLSFQSKVKFIDKAIVKSYVLLIAWIAGPTIFTFEKDDWKNFFLISFCILSIFSIKMIRYLEK